MITVEACMKKDSENERGAVLVLVAAAMVVLLGFVGLAVDTGFLYYLRRVQQTAADGGAMGGASEIRRNRNDLINASAHSGTADNGFAHGVDGVNVAVHHPPISGFYVGNERYVEVVVRRPAPTFFMRVVGYNTVPIAARAVAGWSSDDPACIYVLEDQDADAFSYNSSARLEAACGLQVNSCHPGAALHTTSNATVVVDRVTVGGEISLESSSRLILPEGEEPTTGPPCVHAADPLATLVPPTYGGCSTGPNDADTDWTDFTAGNWTYNAGGSPTVICGGIRLQNNVRLELGPGIYIILGGGIDTESSSQLIGDGVMFFFTQGPGYPYGPLNVESSSRLDLSAPTTGPYAGVLFFQDPNLPSSLDTTVHRFQSSDPAIVQRLEGSLYFPDQILRFESSSHLSVTVTAPQYGAVISRVLVGDSNSILDIGADYSILPNGSPLKRLSLVE